MFGVFLERSITGCPFETTSRRSWTNRRVVAMLLIQPNDVKAVDEAGSCELGISSGGGNVVYSRSKTWWAISKTAADVNKEDVAPVSDSAIKSETWRHGKALERRQSRQERLFSWLWKFPSSRVITTRAAELVGLSPRTAVVSMVMSAGVGSARLCWRRPGVVLDTSLLGLFGCGSCLVATMSNEYNMRCATNTTTCVLDGTRRKTGRSSPPRRAASAVTHRREQKN